MSQPTLESLSLALEKVLANQQQDHQLLQELHELMSTTNATIGQLANDENAVNAALTGFIAAVKAYIAGQVSGASGTVLSAADQATVNQLDQQADAALAAIQAVTVPTEIPANGASGS